MNKNEKICTYDTTETNLYKKYSPFFTNTFALLDKHFQL